MRTLIVTALVVAIVATVVGWAAPAHHSKVATTETAYPRPATGPLQTGIFDPFLYGSSDQDLAFDRTRKAGASTAVLILSWSNVAPGGTNKPGGFDASDPADPHYHWSNFDAELTSAVSHGLEPIVLVVSPPNWAAALDPGGTGRTYEPSPSELAQFGTALATRYSGTFLALPRVRYYSLWNEPNLPFYLQPQLVNGAPYSAGWYRDMVNAFAAAVHAVSPANKIVAGNLAPFTSKTGAADRFGIAPLVFMRALLCLNSSLQPTCNNPVHFDIWAHHPYTSGGPNHQATRPDDVSLGDLPEMRKVLVAGIKAGHVISSDSVAFWVTEFSWDSNPPDPGGLKPGLEARWVAEALYNMWRAGVTMVTWFLVTDQPKELYFAQSGLYLRGATSPQSDQAKPTLAAFRFPFVAYKLGAPKASNRSAVYGKAGVRVLVWGRVPSSAKERVVVEQLRNHAWKPVATVTTNKYGIFGRRLYVPNTGNIRARSLTEAATSRGFSLARPPDHFVSPFGDGWTD